MENQEQMELMVNLAKTGSQDQKEKLEKLGQLARLEEMVPQEKMAFLE